MQIDRVELSLKFTVTMSLQIHRVEFFLISMYQVRCGIVRICYVLE